MLAPWKESDDKPRYHIKKQWHYFANKGLYSKSYCFSSSHVQMGELDYKEGWVPKNSCFWTVVLEKTLESSLESKEIKPVNPKGNQPWIFIGRTDAEAEAPILWLKLFKIYKEPTHWKRPWCWGRLRAGEGCDRERENWMKLLTQCNFEQTPQGSEGQGSLACCSQLGHRDLDIT